MTNISYDYDKDGSFEKATQQMCKCGHKLYMHGFTANYNDYTKTHFLRVSQCTSCGYDYDKDEFECKEFRTKQ
jgi:hypothetical protein